MASACRNPIVDFCKMLTNNAALIWWARYERLPRMQVNLHKIFLQKVGVTVLLSVIFGKPLTRTRTLGDLTRCHLRSTNFIITNSMSILFKSSLNQAILITIVSGHGDFIHISPVEPNLTGWHRNGRIRQHVKSLWLSQISFPIQSNMIMKMIPLKKDKNQSFRAQE